MESAIKLVEERTKIVGYFAQRVVRPHSALLPNIFGHTCPELTESGVVLHVLDFDSFVALCTNQPPNLQQGTGVILDIVLQKDRCSEHLTIREMLGMKANLVVACVKRIRPPRRIRTHHVSIIGKHGSSP